MRLGESLRRRRGDDDWVPRNRPTSSGSRLRLRRGLLLAGGTIVLGFGGGYLYATQIVFPVPETVEADFVEVPDLRGMDAAEAESILVDRGLVPGAVDSISHPDAPRGTVLGQTPFPGQLAVPLGPVGFTISLGPERRPIPDVARLRADQAVTMMEATGFQVEIDSVEAEIPEGRIVSTFPEAGVVLPLPAVVRLSVSQGPPMVAMPALEGTQEEDARVVLDSLGLVVGEVETRFRFGFNQGEVLEQFPPADSLIPAGTRVRLVIGNRGFFEDG